MLTVARFYDRKAWRVLRREILRRDNYSCVRCHAFVGGSGKARIDHIEPVTVAPSRALDPANLRTLCAVCDNRAHSEKALHLPYRVDRMVHGNDELGFPRDASHPWRAQAGAKQ
jgi:5-methylcytosine-specific restriction protein A